MHLNPYGGYAVLLAASLANAWPTDRAGVIAQTREFGMTVEFIASGSDDHQRCRQVIDDWLAVVDAVDAHARAQLLNAQMARAAAYPRLTDHDEEGWHLHYRDLDQSLPHVLLAVISVGTALHITTRGTHRLSRCAAATAIGDPCTNVVVDTTRNGRQRYCCVRCANRAAGQRHRSRTRTSQTSRDEVEFVAIG